MQRKTKLKKKEREDKEKQMIPKLIEWGSYGYRAWTKRREMCDSEKMEIVILMASVLISDII